MKKIRVSVVKYTNSLPFLYGLENHPVKDQLEISRDTPAECYEKLMTNRTDIGLVPVVILNKLDYADIVGHSCIATRGKVRSVILASTVPLNRIEKIYLDYQSRTSINLVRILARKFWRINPRFIQAEEGYELKPIPEGSAFVVIGDRAFSFYNRDYLIFDLGEQWFQHTGKPFVFACWVANKPVDPVFEQTFDEALQLGLDNRDTLIKRIEGDFKEVNVDLKEYFFQNLTYNLGVPEEEGMNLFLNLMRIILNQ